MVGKDKQPECVKATVMYARMRLRKATDRQAGALSSRSITFQRAVFVVWLSVAAAVQAVPTQGTTPAGDPNVQGSADASSAAVARRDVAEVVGRVVDHVLASGATADPNLCAVVVLCGESNCFDQMDNDDDGLVDEPAPAESFSIRLNVFNVAADQLDILILDSFRALGGQSLLHQLVFGTAPPASGTLTVDYPPGDAVPPGGKGPVVLSFTNFTSRNSTAFNTDPDTYDNPEFGATVLDMDETSIELVYVCGESNCFDQMDNDDDGLVDEGGPRCQGTLRFDEVLDASVANIIQIYP